MFNTDISQPGLPSTVRYIYPCNAGGYNYSAVFPVYLQSFIFPPCWKWGWVSKQTQPSQKLSRPDTCPNNAWQIHVGCCIGNDDAAVKENIQDIFSPSSVLLTPFYTSVWELVLLPFISETKNKLKGIQGLIYGKKLRHLPNCLSINLIFHF